MIESIRKSFAAFSKMPFIFAWGSFMYLFLLGAAFFTAVGLGMAYLIALAVFDQPVSLSSTLSLAVFGIIGLAFVFVSNGLNASLARAYHSAFWREKTSLTAFFAYALRMAPEMFGIMLVRDLIWLIFAGPFIAIFVYFLSDVAFMDILLAMYLLFVTFVIHMVFTPAFISAGAFGADLVSALKHSIAFLKKRHFFFMGLYAVFALVWLLNYVPFLDLVTLFFLYPVMYAAMIIMVEDSIKIERAEK